MAVRTVFKVCGNPGILGYTNIYYFSHMMDYMYRNTWVVICISHLDATPGLIIGVPFLYSNILKKTLPFSAPQIKVSTLSCISLHFSL